jgi:hypothetical protein
MAVKERVNDLLSPLLTYRPNNQPNSHRISISASIGVRKRDRNI